LPSFWRIVARRNIAPDNGRQKIAAANSLGLHYSAFPLWRPSRASQINDLARGKSPAAPKSRLNRLSWAKGRQQQRGAMLEDLLQGIELAPQEEVAAQLLALQTRLQASLQTTAMLYQMSIVQFL
jgi:hypothetical protein